MQLLSSRSLKMPPAEQMERGAASAEDVGQRVLDLIEQAKTLIDSDPVLGMRSLNQAQRLYSGMTFDPNMDKLLDETFDAYREKYTS